MKLHVRSRVLLAVVGLLVLASQLSPASAQTGAGRGKPVELSLIEATPAFNNLPIFVIRTQLGREFNLKVAPPAQFQGGGEAGSVFASGQGDLLIAGIDKAVGFVRQGLVDVKVLGPVLVKQPWALVVPRGSSIQSVTDLRGKKIGISGPGSVSDLAVRWGVRREGLDPDKDVSLIALGSVASLRAGIEHGRVEAGVMTSPALEPALREGTVRMLADWTKVDYPGNVIMARAKDLKARPEDFARFMAAYKKALQLLRADRRFATEMARAMFPNASPQDISTQLDTHVGGWWSQDGVLTKELYESARELWVGSGRFKQGEIPEYESLVVTLPDAG